MNYRVEWAIDIFDVSTPEEAAREARNSQTRSGTTATVFDVYEHDADKMPVRVDLIETEK